MSDEHPAAGPETDLALARTVFGNRAELAVRYWELLGTAAVERGFIGPREVPRLWERHLLNCAAVAELIPDGASVVDVGSGAGLPGVVLIVARPDLHVTLLEPLLRRSVFLTEVVDELGLSANVVRGRAEDVQVRTNVGGADVVVSRAVAPLAKLMRWCVPLARPEGVVLAMKGSSAQTELDRDAPVVRTLGVRGLEVVECGAGLLVEPTLVVRATRSPSTR